MNGAAQAGPAPVPPAFYVREDHGFAPTGLGASIWDATAQGGVSLAGLIGHVIGTVPQPVPMLATRLTIDILGTVPLQPLFPVVRILREGRRLQLVEAELQAAGRTWVRASALRVRLEPTTPHVAALTQPLPEAAGIAITTTRLTDSVHLSGGLQTPGRGARWVRFIPQVVAGEPLTGLERMAMIADWAAAVAPLFSPREWTLANVDISLHLSRLPQDDWLLVDATSESAGNGIAIANGRLGDRHGMFGSSHQTVFLNRRPVPLA